MKVHVLSACKVLRHGVNVAVEVPAIPVRGKGIVKPGVDGNYILPLGRDGEGRYNVHAFVELGINKPRLRGKFAVLARVQRGLVQRGIKQLYFLCGKVGVVLPGHKLAPYFRVVPAV